ncbi:MAG: hypothetical protein K2W84_17580 [Burkholderiales bacterium]|nr:hypothetical protein [Burkholderiales bacterium]
MRFIDMWTLLQGDDSVELAILPRSRNMSLHIPAGLGKLAGEDLPQQFFITRISRRPGGEP